MLTASTQLSNTLEKEELYQQIVEYSDETTIFHPNQKTLYINQLSTNFNVTKSVLIGVHALDIFAEDYQKAITERIHYVPWIID